MKKINILKIGLKLDTTEKIILETVKKYCNQKLVNYTKNNFEKNNPKKIYKEFGELGLLGPLLKDYDCLGTTYKMYGLIAKEVEYIDSGYRSMFSVQSSLVMNPIDKYGSEIVKEKYLRDLAKGEKIGCFGLTEPHSGSDASAMKTKAEKKGEYYLLNGSKTWITNSPIADVFVVWAKNNGIINGFVLDRTMKGIHTQSIKRKMSLNSSITGTIFLDDVVVHESNKLNVNGMKGPLSCLNDARLGISFGVLGSSKFCIQQVLDYANNRKMFGSLLSEKQLFQNKLINMITDYNLGLLASLEVAENVDSGDSIPEMISLIKRNNCQKSLDTARLCRDILGGNGITEDYDVFRHLVNLETVNTYEGTFDTHTLILGKYFTGYNAF